LRDRGDDIDLLVRSIVERLRDRLGQPSLGIDDAAVARLTPEASEMSSYSANQEITPICADFVVVRAVWPNRSAAGGAESRRFSRHTFS
jgi:hypothetical protein